jgi:Protein of unknown function (DUF3089)
MRHRPGSGRTVAAAGRTRLIALLGVAALLVLGAMTGTALAHKSENVWLCKPGKKPDPCKESLTATVVNSDLSTSEEKAKDAAKPPIDCFYVYPTVSGQPTLNATLAIEPEETQIAIDQASRFSQDCKVYAPMYKQLTLTAIKGPPNEAGEFIAFLSMKAAWQEYMARFNKGRPVVLIGHSQGSGLLEQLIKEEFDSNAMMREKLVSAVILGGQVIVPEGHTEGGTFQHIPACQSDLETACVIAYSSFGKEPPEPSLFGRVKSIFNPSGEVPGVTDPQVLCVNPALLTQNGGSGSLQAYASTTPFPGPLGEAVPAPKGFSTPWVTTPGEFNAQCKHENGASWLQITQAEGDPREPALETVGPEWGLHLYDVNIALGNLVKTVGIQAQVYGFEH